MSWQRYAIERLLIGVGLLLGASVVVFLIIRLVPGDPAIYLAGAYGTDASIEAMRRKLGLTQPIWKQYFIWMGDILTGNLGESLISGKPVTELLSQRYPRSLELTILSLGISILIAFPAGVVSGANRNTKKDYVALLFSQVGVSMPSFWLGLLFILLFAKYLNLLPPSGYIPFTEDPIGNLKHAILPALTLGIINAAVITRFLRSSILDDIGSDYVRTARAFGFQRKTIIRKYVLKNALIPTVTVIGLQVGWLIGGVVIVEKVFGWPGIGLLTLNSIIRRNYTVVQPSLLALAATFIVVNLIVDLLYGWLNPKIKY